VYYLSTESLKVLGENGVTKIGIYGFETRTAIYTTEMREEWKSMSEGWEGG
jgi:hypothetical protein